ncbi:MAG: hypothetical protein GY783_04025 [Gammaproteobacteria bacterium]|nr:hypothetical protein [Gammaproteobacteria bacterium]
MPQAFICDAVRTPVGRCGGSLASVRADDLGAIPLAALLERNKKLNPVAIEDLAYGCANQAGEDNRNAARMSLLLAQLPVTVPAVTVTRLCGSGMNAIGNIVDSIRTGAIQLGVADDAAHVNPNGGAIALGHPLGMSGARLVTTAAYQLRRSGGFRALCTMCIGVGQGIAMIIERV